MPYVYQYHRVLLLSCNLPVIDDPALDPCRLSSNTDTAALSSLNRGASSESVGVGVDAPAGHLAVGCVGIKTAVSAFTISVTLGEAQELTAKNQAQERGGGAWRPLGCCALVCVRGARRETG